MAAYDAHDVTARRKRGLSAVGFAYLILIPAIVVVFGIIVSPLVTTFIYSLKNMELISANRGQFVWLSNYAKILGSQEFWGSFWRTVYFTLVSLTLETVLGLLVALLLNGDFKGVGFVRTIIILPWAVPTIVSGAMWRWIYNSEYGILNAVLSALHLIKGYHSWLGSPVSAMNMVIIADVWKMTPFAVIFFLAALQMINKSMYEAAMVDGAGASRRFFALTLPYLRPVIAVVVVMRTMEKFKAFDLFYAITRGGPANGTMVLTYEAYLAAFSHLQYSIAATIAYLIGIIILLLTLSYARLLKSEGEMYD